MNNIAKLSECEEMIMKIVWSGSHDTDLQTITARAKKVFKKSWKLQTVCTFLVRLKDKGYLEIYKKGRYSYYKPLISLEAYRSLKLKEALNMWFDGNKDACHMAIDELE